MIDFYVYRTKSTGKPFYVGRTSDSISRECQHANDSLDVNAFIKATGRDNVLMEIVLSLSNEQDKFLLDTIEDNLIDLFETGVWHGKEGLNQKYQRPSFTSLAKNKFKHADLHGGDGPFLVIRKCPQIYQSGETFSEHPRWTMKLYWSREEANTAVQQPCLFPRMRQTQASGAGRCEGPASHFVFQLRRESNTDVTTTTRPDHGLDNDSVSARLAESQESSSD